VGTVSRLASAATVTDRLPRLAHTLADGLYGGLLLANARDDALGTVRSVAGSVHRFARPDGRGARRGRCRPGSAGSSDGVAPNRVARNRFLANVAAARYGI
jgi:hypothetical protein